MTPLTTTTTASAPIHAATCIGAVELTVSDLDRSHGFYERLLGFSASVLDDGSVAFAPASGPALIRAVANPSGQPRNPAQAGLYHFAILVRARRDLAVALVRLIQGGWRLAGASDHEVSEALYLDDPDGNGVEIYRDRPRDEWHHHADGQVAMATLPLNLNNLLAELEDVPPDPDADALLPAGTRLGHMHLQVSDVAAAKRFYVDRLGFEITAHDVPQALFISAGGYHHHIAFNSWHSRGGSQPPPGAIGLRSYEIRLPTPDALAEVRARLDAAGISTEQVTDATRVRDPSGNTLLLTL